MKRFPSIKSNMDFQYAYHHGRSSASGEMVVYCVKNGMNINRIGISCSKKVGNSVIRHRMARVFREIFRLNSNNVIKGVDIVVVIRKKSCLKTFSELEKVYCSLLGKNHVLIEKPE